MPLQTHPPLNLPLLALNFHIPCRYSRQPKHNLPPQLFSSSLQNRHHYPLEPRIISISQVHRYHVRANGVYLEYEHVINLGLDQLSG